MTEPMAGGRRRIDRVLAPDFLDRLEERDLAEVRAMRHEAEQEETDLSFARRMLQGRMDILRAEIARRQQSGEGGQDVVAHLAQVLADEPRRSNHGLGRHLTVEPSRVGEHRREVEQVIADVGISDLAAQSDEALRAELERLGGYERRVSGLRQQVQAVMDRCTTEVGRRYREGLASVEDVLPGS